MTEKTIFKKIIDRQIPAEIIFEDQHCLAFHDVSPQAPVHVLVIPKKEIRSLAELQGSDSELAGQLLITISKVAEQLGLNDYRVISNCGESAGQSVFHLHFHILGGRDLSWPPG